MEDDVDLLTSSLNVHEPFDCSSTSNGASSDEDRQFHTVDTSAVSLQSGMLMHTKQGLICLTLKDSLTSDLGGLNLSIEDLQHVAEQLSQQNGISVEPHGCQIPLGARETVPETQEGQLTSGDNCTKSTYECILVNNLLNKAEEFVAVSNPIEPLELELVTSIPALETADTLQPVMPKAIQVPVSIAKANSAPESSHKKRGGWPKGRKRKPEVAVRPPKAPATGYVLYLNEKRKLYKDIPFPDVTKLLGNEWSRMSLAEKRVYLDQAEVEKKRYKHELSLYRKSDAYRSYVSEQRLKSVQNNGTEESDMDATDEIDEEDNEELYCRTCDQWFNTLHNKKEHLYGRQHLQSISNEFSKRRSRKQNTIDSGNGSSCSLDESSLDGTSNQLANVMEIGKLQNRNSGQESTLYMNDAIVNFMQIVADREKEALVLQQRVSYLRRERQKFEQEIVELRNREVQAKALQDSEQVQASDLENQLFNLLAVPALFMESSEVSEDGLECDTSGMTCDVSNTFTLGSDIPSNVVLVLSDDVIPSLDNDSDTLITS